MSILGIDPGMGATGYAVLEKTPAGLVLKKSGEIRTVPKDPFPDRLKHLFDRLQQVIEEDPPSAIAIEDTFLAKNFKSALKLGQARGVALLTAAFHRLPVYEYTPTEVKMAVVGFGQASKDQIQQMVCRLLRLPVIPASEHAADAAAVGICHAHSIQFREKIAAGLLIKGAAKGARNGTSHER
ncbi:MAG: crossover junction endodeoxyribonuclease RuvC [Candidatus Manganitrophaceae bacterium]